jgi:hypothetical protein
MAEDAVRRDRAFIEMIDSPMPYWSERASFFERILRKSMYTELG